MLHIAIEFERSIKLINFKGKSFAIRWISKRPNISLYLASIHLYLFRFLVFRITQSALTMYRRRCRRRRVCLRKTNHISRMLVINIVATRNFSYEICFA